MYTFFIKNIYNSLQKDTMNQNMIELLKKPLLMSLIHS